MKKVLLIATLLSGVLVSCNEEVTEIVTEPIQVEEIKNKYENTLEDFKEFSKEFEVIITDSVAVLEINKSNMSFAGLQTNNFIDTNGLVERIPNKALFGGGEYELNSYFEFNAGDEIFESSIIYYFNYDSIAKSFVIVDMMMAG
jgi:hypothetical protein